MVDNFSILLSHALLGLALWRLMMMDALDQEPPAPDWDEPDADDRRRDGWRAGTGPGARAADDAWTTPADRAGRAGPGAGVGGWSRHA